MSACLRPTMPAVRLSVEADLDASVLQRLRYKDFQLVARPAAIERDAMHPSGSDHRTGLYETDSVKDFAVQMDNRGILAWWKKGMGYTGSEDRL